eukprot:c18824_g1_i1 orf=416-2629(+)
MVSDSNAQDNRAAAYEGWLYHVGGSSLGYTFCHARYLRIKGKYVEMYKRDPNERPRKPVRKGIVGQYLMAEELGRRMYHGKALYIFRIYSLVDHNKQGKLACSSAEDVGKWISAFQHAKEEAESGLEKASRRLMNSEQEFKLNGFRYYSRPYLRSPRNFITIGRGPESLLRRPSMITQDPDDVEDYYKHQEGDAIEQENWRCILTVNGLRIFEDVSNSKSKKGATYVKSVGVVEATPDTVFDMIMTLDKSQRQQWDILTGDLELVEEIDGHSDIVHGVYDPKFHKRCCLKSHFLLLRRWRHDQDGSYSITEDSATHKQYPQTLGYHGIKLNPGVWEITPLLPRCGTPRTLVTQIMEIKSPGWYSWKKLTKFFSPGFQNTVPYFLLCRTAGLREFFAANNELTNMELMQTVSISKESELHVLPTQDEQDAPEINEQFYDAIAAADPTGEGDSDEEEYTGVYKVPSQRRKLSWSSRLGLPSKRPPIREENEELMLDASPVNINLNQFKGSLREGTSDTDSNCWSAPGGNGFMVRGRTYTNDFIKVPGGDPLLKLLGVEWLKSDKKIEMIARHPRCLVKSADAKKLPFILLVNLQIPAKSNYSLIFYFGAERPIRPGSLLHKFSTGDDSFRNSRLKLIPRIAEGYWVIKRAVGTKACLLGRALTCKYFQNDNVLEIDVDVGSSSVARSVCGLVLGYATSVVIDFAILIEACQENELPEYLLGVSRINRITPESALAYEEM